MHCFTCVNVELDLTFYCPAFQSHMDLQQFLSAPIILNCWVSLADFLISLCSNNFVSTVNKVNHSNTVRASQFAHKLFVRWFLHWVKVLFGFLNTTWIITHHYIWKSYLDPAWNLWDPRKSLHQLWSCCSQTDSNGFGRTVTSLSPSDRFLGCV